MRARNKTNRSKSKYYLVSKKSSNKNIILRILAILYLLLITTILTVYAPFVMAQPQKTYEYIFRPFTNNFELWINNSWVPVNQTFLEIPSQNYSLTFGEAKEHLINEGFGMFWPGFDIFIRNATLQKDARNAPYYVGKIGIGNPLNWDEDVFSEAKATLHPFDIRDYFYKPFYLFFDVFLTDKDKVKEQLSYQDVINYWNSTPFVPHVFNNNTKFLPLIAPGNKNYYGEMAIEGKLLWSRFINNEEWKNNVKTFFAWWVNPFPEYSFLNDLTGFILNVSLSIDNTYYNATINLESILNINDKLVVGYELVNSSVLFYDKTRHTQIKIVKGFEIPSWYAIKIAAPASASNSKNDFLLSDYIDYKWAPFSLVLAVLITKTIVVSSSTPKEKKVLKKRD